MNIKLFLARCILGIVSAGVAIPILYTVVVEPDFRAVILFAVAFYVALGGIFWAVDVVTNGEGK